MEKGRLKKSWLDLGQITRILFALKDLLVDCLYSTVLLNWNDIWIWKYSMRSNINDYANVTVFVPVSWLPNSCTVMSLKCEQRKTSGHVRAVRRKTALGFWRRMVVCGPFINNFEYTHDSMTTWQLLFEVTAGGCTFPPQFKHYVKVGGLLKITSANPFPQDAHNESEGKSRDWFGQVHRLPEQRTLYFFSLFRCLDEVSFV